MTDAIDQGALTQWLNANPDWRVEEGAGTRALKADFKFKNFTQAFQFLNDLAKIMEQNNHHAEIYNLYNRVTLTLSTHDAGNKITHKDLHIASEAQNLLP